MIFQKPRLPRQMRVLSSEMAGPFMSKGNIFSTKSLAIGWFQEDSRQILP